MQPHTHVIEQHVAAGLGIRSSLCCVCLCVRVCVGGWCELNGEVTSFQAGFFLCPATRVFPPLPWPLAAVCNVKCMYPCPGTSCCMQTSPANVWLRERERGGGGGGKIDREGEGKRESVCIFCV